MSESERDYELRWLWSLLAGDEVRLFGRRVEVTWPEGKPSIVESFARGRLRDLPHPLAPGVYRRVAEGKTRAGFLALLIRAGGQVGPPTQKSPPPHPPG